jgi:hypothetical protein
MNAKLKIHRIWFAGLLGAAVLAGSPIVAQADQGKWWEPKQDRTPARERRVERQVRSDRGDRGAYRGYQQGRPRFQRSYVVLRDGYRGHSYRARRVWARPYYIERQHLCVIRPVRYFVGASAYIGGVRISARFHDHDRYLYGCNFCDARFGGYDAYRSHVLRCDDRPRGYRIDVSDWNNDWDNEACDVDGCEIHGGHGDGHGYAHGDDRDYDRDYDDRYDR